MSASDNRANRSKRRSRFGCRNCKLRRVKCDEDRPQCRRCVSFGVLCNITLRVPDLQPVTNDVELKPPARRDRGNKVVVRAPLSNAVWTADASSHYQLNDKCQDFVTRYLGESLLNPKNSKMAEVNRKLLGFAFTHPYLMHASLAVALCYDRHHSAHLPNTSLTNHNRTVEECHHLSLGTALLNKRLTQPITEADKDPIWGTAAALAMLSFASPDGSSHAPETSWPMRSSSETDLEWLRLNKGKMALWPLINPIRPGSIFRVMAATYAEMHAPRAERGVGGIPPDLARVCGLNDASTAGNSPYFDAAHALARILCLDDGEVRVGHTEVFTRCIEGRFQDLVLSKDPVALLLMFLWYRKGARSIWWIDVRARVECPAICLYLRRHWASRRDVLVLLEEGSLAGCESYTSTFK
ncbi:hypothetical protein F4808DRAFT_381729 [Astrocystis sublimbata]|nr:hypothetical protein F4808DRAFT_381729 [Astrocystis sublimbata]